MVVCAEKEGRHSVALCWCCQDTVPFPVLSIYWYYFTIDLQVIFTGEIVQKEINKARILNPDNIGVHFFAHLVINSNSIVCIIPVDGTKYIIILCPVDMIYIEQSVFIKFVRYSFGGKIVRNFIAILGLGDDVMSARAISIGVNNQARLLSINYFINIT